MMAVEASYINKAIEELHRERDRLRQLFQPSTRARFARDARLAGASWNEIAERFGYTDLTSVYSSVRHVARDAEEWERLKAAARRPPGRSENGKGYIRVPAPPGHPLAHKIGTIYEHRLVLYDALGAGPHECEYCGVPLDWERVKVDHRNGDRADNRLENLAIACNRCNIVLGDHGGPTEDELLVEMWRRGHLDLEELAA